MNNIVHIIAGRLGLLTLVFLLFGCQFFESEEPVSNESPIARVGNHFLYPSELTGIVSQNASVDDSIAQIEVYVDDWVKEHTIILGAEDDSTLNVAAIERKVKTLRNQLLVYAYQKSYVETELDTVVSETELQKYYEEHQTDFQLDTPIMKGLFIKVAKTAPEVNLTINTFYKTNSPTVLEEVKLYSANFATSYYIKDSSWVDLHILIDGTPFSKTNSTQLLKGAKYMKRSDQDFHYLLKVNEYKLSGEVAPFEYRKEEIRSIILGQRKQALLEEMENKLYEKAVNAKNVERFE